MGGRSLVGTIAEDAGLLGAGGRRLYRIKIHIDPDEEAEFVLPEDEIQLVTEPRACPLPQVDAIVDYLKHGGLLAILRSNAGGRNQPRVWLRTDNVGGVTHTFVAERGQFGGRPVPFGTLHGDRIFLPKQDEVVEFLASFGLDRPRIDEILRAVRTSP